MPVDTTAEAHALLMTAFKGDGTIFLGQAGDRPAIFASGQSMIPDNASLQTNRRWVASLEGIEQLGFVKKRGGLFRLASRGSQAAKELIAMGLG